MSATKQVDSEIKIKPLNKIRMVLTVTDADGTPLVLNKFSKKARDQMKAAMSTPKNQKKSRGEREPRDFERDFREAQYVSEDGWHGFPANALRKAMVDACRSVGVPMTRAKQAIWIIADGYDAQDSIPLVRLLADAPTPREDLVRNDNGSADIRVRPMWRKWSAKVTIDFDADMITAESVVNLLVRAGLQVGLGEGRHFSKDGVGMGWGYFDVETQVTQ